MTEALLLAVPLIIGGLVAWLGMGRPSLGEFLDRPVCWLIGHDLTSPVFETTYENFGKSYRATVWRCSRHQGPVIVVGARHRADAKQQP